MAAVPRIARGGVISFRYLHALEDSVIAAGRQGAPVTTAAAQIDNAGQSNVSVEQAFDGRAQRQAGVQPVTSADNWTEIDRTTSTVRVENPEDAEQYVDVERVEVVRFRNGTGRTLVLNLDNDA